MTRAEVGSLLACAALAVVASRGAGGCTDDGRVLWQVGGESGEGGEPGGGYGGQPEPPPPGGHPPIPCVAEGPDPEPVCDCPPASACICEPEMGEGPCAIHCDTDCDLICGPERHCNLECGGGCFARCEPGSVCTIGCGADCVVICSDGAHCELWSWDGPSDIYCELGAVCECPVPGGCFCSGPGCPEPPPGG